MECPVQWYICRVFQLVMILNYHSNRETAKLRLITYPVTGLEKCKKIKALLPDPCLCLNFAHTGFISRFRLYSSVRRNTISSRFIRREILARFSSQKFRQVFFMPKFQAEYFMPISKPKYFIIGMRYSLYKFHLNNAIL